MVSEGGLINFQNAPLQFFQLSAMPIAEKLALKKKLKTELAHVRSAVENIIADCERRFAQKHSDVVEDQAEILGNESVASVHSFCNPDQQPYSSGENYKVTTGKKRIAPEMNKRPKDGDNYSSDEIAMVPEKSESRSVVTGACKGISLGTSDDQKGKGEKMDSSKTRQCANTLKILMNHPAGWVFNQPVDPVKLNIPDYFSVISKPMDLGTIKYKLQSKQYSSTLQFSADVTLTFSNAMRYNPPGNEVHVMAKELNSTFNSRWNLLEAKWRKESTVSSPQSVTNTQKKRQVLQKKPNVNSFLRRSITSAEKMKLKKDLSNLPAKKMPPRLISFLQGKCVPGQIGDLVDIDINMFDEETLCELHQIVKSCFDARSTEINKCAWQPEQDSRIGTCETVLVPGVVDESMGPSACMKNTHRTVEGRCSRRNDFSQASSDVDSERSSGRDHFSCHSTVYDADSKKTPTGFGLGSNDAIQAIPCPSSPPTAATEEIGLPHEEQLSPTKALRAAMLKSRFADTILKAQQRSLGEKVDPAKLQQEREKLEKKQQEEKARIEAQVKAAEFAARMKAEAELKIQREREREAARLALQKMEKTVEIDNSHISKDLENLGCPLPGNFDVPDEQAGNFVHELELQSGLVNPLEQLGLFMKNEDLDEFDDWNSAAAGNGDVEEEGEINYS